MDLSLVAYIPSPVNTAIYRECLKNHAASMGGQSFDGCGEFMPNFKGEKLNCAACGCHRNFHRREMFPDKSPLLIPSPAPVSFFRPARRQDGLIRKRYRTKFTAEQKEKMRIFAEKIGWRVQKHDCEAFERFCMQVGVKRHVLKVWMHNHKSSFSSPAGGGEDHAVALPSIRV